MAEKRKRVTDEDITGLKYFRRLLPLFERLHEVGCQRDQAGNRTLHMDQYCSLVLLYLFNPVVVSLRSLQQASELKKVQKKLGCARASLGSLSESSHVFDPELLQEIVRELGKQLQPIAADARLAEIKHTVTLVDGTLLKALPRITEAMWLTTRTGTKHHAWRLHTQFELDKHVPLRMDLTNGRNSGPSDEKTVLRAHLEPDRCYVMDRWYAQFTLFNDIHRAGSSYVCRLRDNTVPEIVEERPLSDEAIAAGVLSDQMVRLGLIEASHRASRPSAAAGDGPHRAAREAFQPQRQHGSRPQRRHPADRHQPARSAGLDHRPDLSAPLDDRTLLPLLQARAGLPAPAEPRSPRHRDPDLLRDHRLHADQPLDRPQADAADLRDDLPLLHRPGRRGRTAGPSGQAEKSQCLTCSAAPPPADTSRITLCQDKHSPQAATK